MPDTRSLAPAFSVFKGQFGSLPQSDPILAINGVFPKATARFHHVGNRSRQHAQKTLAMKWIFAGIQEAVLTQENRLPAVHAILVDRRGHLARLLVDWRVMGLAEIGDLTHLRSIF